MSKQKSEGKLFAFPSDLPNLSQSAQNFFTYWKVHIKKLTGKDGARGVSAGAGACGRKV